MTASNRVLFFSNCTGATKHVRMAAALAGLALVLSACMLSGASAQAYAADTSFAAGSLDAATMQTQADDYSIKWYEEGQSPYTISNVKDLKGLAYLVNSGVDTFEGKEVDLKEGVSFIFDGTAIDPIGTEEHPFQGTFDGRRGSAVGKGIVAMASETRIQNLTVNVGDKLHYIGLFGYAGEQATIRNLTVNGGSSVLTVENEADGLNISHVGAIAGYLGGSMENCYSSVDISIVNNGKVPEKKAETTEELCMILYIGGLVGELKGDMESCVHDADGLSISSNSNVSVNVPFIGALIGGIAGYQGDEEHPELVPEARNCKNSGPLTFNVSGKGGVDRFGQQMYSKSLMVGGIVGYTMGNVTDCSNMATIQTGIVVDGANQAGWGASAVGGIVGSLRGPTVIDSAAESGVTGSDNTDPGYTVWTESKGTEKPAVLTIGRCSNTGTLVGLTSVAGICGSSGAFTRIVGCSNAGEVTGTRWNKPCPAGIVGITNGDVAYCCNTGRIVTLTGGGYYASGITALLTTYNNSTTASALLLDAPEIYGCYVTGSIVSSNAGYRAAVIAGENDGYIHDNCYLPNLVADKYVPKEWATILGYIENDGTIDANHVDEVKYLVGRVNVLDGTALDVTVNAAGVAVLVNGDSSSQEKALDVLNKHCSRSQIVEKDQDRGTTENNYELSAGELRSAQGISYLNRPNGSKSDWSLYYVSNPDDAGFPLLNWQRGEADSRIDLSSAEGLVVSLAEGGDPQYSSAVVPIPTLTVTLNGEPLYQNADYRVIPEDGATAIGSGYTAHIEGIDRYQGIAASTANYSIVKCDISKCKVTAASARFNWKRQEPSWVKVIDEAGNEVDSNEYEWCTLANSDGNPKAVGGKFYDYINVHNASYKYDIKVTTKPTSTNYFGETVQAAFHISWATLYFNTKSTVENEDPTAEYDKVVWGDQSWSFKDAYETKGFVKIKYTGSAIEPKIANPTYLGVSLRDGTGKDYATHPLDYDFKYVYGNPNPESLASDSTDCIDVTGSEETKLACMTIRFTPSGNFDNYENVFFEITPADIASDVKVTGLKKQYAYTGKAIKCEPVLKYNGMTLTKGVDYTLSYKNNKSIGTASVIIKGKGNYAGTLKKAFKIARANTLTVKAKKAVTVKASTLSKKAQTIKANVLMKVAKAKGAVTYAKSGVVKKAFAKYFTVNKKTGAVKIKKGLPKGAYKLKVAVKAAGNKSYSPATKNVTVKIQVK